MATFPTIDFSQYQWAVNDSDYLAKWNDEKTALNTLQTNIDTFGTDMNQAKTNAEQAATAASDYRDEARQFRDEAQAIAVGDVAITDLQPGPIDTPGDYVSSDGAGGLVKRSLPDDVTEQLAGSSTLGRYNATVYGITDSAAHTVDCSIYQGIYITAGSPTITLTNIVQLGSGAPNGNGQMVFPITAYNTSAFSITNSIRWSDNEDPPELGASATVIALTLTSDYQILGSVGHKS